MSETRYKVGDVVMSHGKPIIGYDEDEDTHFSNALCVVRRILMTALTPPEPVYRCTLIATGEEVDLLEEEIVEVKD